MANLVANKQINLSTFSFASFTGPDATKLDFARNFIQVEFNNGDIHRFEGSFGVNIFARLDGWRD